MLETLSLRFQDTVKKLRGQARITEENISETIREIRRALLEADVALPVVKQVVDEIKDQALNQSVTRSLTPGQQVIKIVQSELTGLIGREQVPLNLRVQPPAVVLIAGLQGVGKTTSVGKIAKYLTQQNKRVLVVSSDIYRPAAREQLSIFTKDQGIDYHAAEGENDPIAIAISGVEAAKKRLYDVLLVDTAGRQHIDDEMMREVRTLQKRLNPIETLLAVDAQAGQDALSSAKAFHEALPLTGLIITKADGDARGGAILSARKVTGCPVKFIATGERIEDLEPFHPDRIASQILGMGNMLGMIEDIERKADLKQAKKSAEKLKKGKGFDMHDLRDQLEQMLNIGGSSSLLDKLPNMGRMKEKLAGQVNDTQIKRQIAIINSMTNEERSNPDLIRRTRKLRIANGSGTSVPMINILLKQYLQMNGMMKKMKNPKAAKRMLSGLNLPPGFNL